MSHAYSRALTTDSCCPLYGSSRLKLRYPTAGHFQISGENVFHCRTTNRVRPEIVGRESCQHVFSNPKEWPIDLESEYGELEDHLYLGMLPIKRRTFSRVADVLGVSVKLPARVLEIGFYAGLFLDECRDRGYTCLAIKPSTWGARISRERGHDVRTGTAEEIRADDEIESFDAVVSWDVLEHVRDPARFLSMASRRVRAGGFLIFSTLDRTNWFARIMGRRWPWLIPMHLHYFDQRTVIDATQALGFDFVATRPHVHYTSANHAMTRALGRTSTNSERTHSTYLDRLSFPVKFGNVRTYIFRKTR
jgi:SAM-dependent methyltransferase